MRDRSRRILEREAATMSVRRTENQPSIEELRTGLDRAIGELSEKYRAPIVLCHLENKSYDHAARELLRAKLERHGITLTATALTTALTSSSQAAPLPAFLAINTVKAAALIAAGKTAAGLSATALAMAEDSIGTMFLAKGKMFVVALTVMLVAGGGGRAAFKGNSGDIGQTQKKQIRLMLSPEAEAKPDDSIEKQPRLDNYGDPLPKGTIARIGTTRYWPHNVSFTKVIYTRDGKQIVYNSGDAVCFFDPASGKELHRVEVQGHEFKDFAISPDGKYLATLGSDNPRTSEIYLWDMASLKKLHRISETIFHKDGAGVDAFHFVNFTPDGKTLAASKWNKIRRWDVPSWKEKPPLDVGEHRYLRFLPDAKTVVLATSENIRWWDIATGKEARQLDSIEMVWPDQDIAVSPNGKHLAVVDKKNVLHLLNAETGVETGRVVTVAKERGPRDGPWVGFYFGPDSQSLVYCVTPWNMEDSEAVFVTADTGRELKRWKKGVALTSPSFAPDGKTFVEHYNYAYINIRDTETGRLLNGDGRLPWSVASLQFAQDSKSLVAGISDGSVFFWDSISGRQQGKSWGVTKEASGADFAGFNIGCKLLATTDNDGTLFVLESKTGKQLHRLKGQSKLNWPALFSPSDKFLVCDDKSERLCLWDLTRGQLVGVVGPKQSFCRAFSPDSRVLATGSYIENDICLWDAATGQEIKKLSSKHGRPANGLRFSADGRILTSAHTMPGNDQDRPFKEGWLIIWDWASGREINQFRLGPEMSDDGVMLALSVDRGNIALAGYAGNCPLTLIELATGKVRARLPGHRMGICASAFSHDGRLLATAGADQTVLVWDLTGISPDGKLTVRDVSTEECLRLWAELGDDDAAKAYRALWAMVASQRQTVPYLAKQLRPVPAVDSDRLTQLIRELDSEQFKVRNQASKDLEELGVLAKPALMAALANGPTLELRKRVDRLLDNLAAKPLSAKQVHVLRALEVLEQIATPQARAIIANLARGALGAPETEEAKAALGRLTRGLPTTP